MKQQCSISFALDSTSAVFSKCRLHRYSLHRQWAPSGTTCAFVGLNPSTADEVQDDPTIRRCIRFARDWGHGSLVMLNLFPLRSTDPGELRRQTILPGFIKANIEEIRLRASQAARVVVCWGAHGTLDGMDKRVLSVLRDVGHAPVCLGINRDGTPKHPLYLKADTPVVPYEAEARAAGEEPPR